MAYRRGGGYSKRKKSSYGGRRKGGKYSKKRYSTQRKPMYHKQNVRKSKGSDQLSVYVNPWSTATTNPKVPDGKCRLSTGLRLQNVHEYLNDNNGPMEFIIFPGCACGLSANSRTVDNSMPPGSISAVGSEGDLLYENHGTFTPSKNGNFEVFVQERSAAIAKWRLVSQAVRFTLINNADENDGWFEAIRFTVTSDYGKLIAKRTAATGGVGYVAPTDGQANPGNGPGHDSIFDNIGNLVEHPSYISGKLRDIHRYQFQLRPIDTDHDFRDVHRQYVIHENAILGDDDPDPLSTAGYTQDDFSHEAREMKDGLVDQSYDLIFIRCHGRAAATGVNPTRIMAHVVSNQEIMYEQGSAFSRYHSETDASPYFKPVSQKMVEGNIKAGWKTKAS